MQIRLLRVDSGEKLFQARRNRRRDKSRCEIYLCHKIRTLRNSWRKEIGEDLYHRLNVVTITVPSLKERKDIPLLIRHFIATPIMEGL